MKTRTRVCNGITDTLWRERRAGRCKAPRHRRCGVIVEERQHRRCPPAAAPLRAAARRPAGVVARSSHTIRYARRSRLASEPGGRQQSASVIPSQTLIIGVGSPIRGDDGVGIEIARRCGELFSQNEDIRTVEIGTGGLSLLDMVSGYDRVILIDAVISGSPTGTVQVLTEGELTGMVHLGGGHEADLATTLALGRKLAAKPLPRQVHIVAVEVRDITVFSENLSPEVEAAVPEAVAAVEKLLSG